MKNKPKVKKFIEQPSYPGGNKALDEFIRTNMLYPEEALKNSVHGSVTIKFDIDVIGNVIDAKITHGIGYGCDEESLRLVKLLKFEKKKYKGYHVIYHRTLTIHFRLPGKPLQQQQDVMIQYQYNDEKSEEQNPINITITITPTGNK